MTRRSAPMNWPASLIEAAPNVFGYVQGRGYYTHRANLERLPMIAQRLNMEFAGEM